MTKTGPKNEGPTSNIERPTSIFGTPSAFQLYKKNGAKRHPHSTFDVERSMFDVHLFPVWNFEFRSL